MRNDILSGRFVHGELISTDARTAAAVTLYDQNGAAYTITANEALHIVTISCYHAAADTIDVFQDLATAGTVNNGERIWNTAGSTTAGNAQCTYVHFGESGRPCKLNTVPKVKAAAAGAVAVVITGYVA